MQTFKTDAIVFISNAIRFIRIRVSLLILTPSLGETIILLIYDHMTLGIKRACYGHDHTVVGFITTYAINVYYH
jgi:hypothetical protein